MQEDALAMKPHHFVDIVVTFGAGQRTFQPHPYGHALHTVSECILRDHDMLLHVELGADAICQPCIHNVCGRCDDTIDTSGRPTVPAAKGEYNRLLDQRWCERLQLKQGDRLTVRALSDRIAGSLAHLADIYREAPADRVLERTANLRRGLAFLAR